MTRPQWLPFRSDAAGILLAVAFGGAAMGLARALPRTPFLSDILIALVLGAVVLNTPLRRVFGLEVPGHEREPDRYAGGLRFVGKWLLRLAILLMGLKVRTEFFHAAELAIIAGTITVALPSAFFVAHAVSAWLGIRRPMAHLLAGGTMICGASAVNAIAPTVGARREEQGVATAAIFLFSVVALVVFRPVAHLCGLDSVHAGLWSGLAVNDLSSAIAVGAQMGGDGGVVAAASKSARVLMLAPTLFVLALMRGRAERKPGAAATGLLPRYLFGYVALALVRAVGDRLWAGSDAWAAVLAADAFLVELLLLAVAAAIGLHLEVRHLLGSSVRAVLASGATSLWMAGLTLAMVVLWARGAVAATALVGLSALLVTFLAYRATAAGEKALRLLRARFEAGLPLSLAEATLLLDAREAEAQPIDDPLARKILRQLHPSIGELIPARESPLAHGDGTRWLTYWEGRSGWALVAVCREPGSATPIHAHPHRLIAKTIEGVVEELTFREESAEQAVLVQRKVLAHDELVETDGLRTVHAIRALGERPAIDLQLRGPEEGRPGRMLRTASSVDLTRLSVGERIAVLTEVDARPGHAGEGAGAGRLPAGASS